MRGPRPGQRICRQRRTDLHRLVGRGGQQSTTDAWKYPRRQRDLKTAGFHSVVTKREHVGVAIHREGSSPEFTGVAIHREMPFRKLQDVAIHRDVHHWLRVGGRDSP